MIDDKTLGPVVLSIEGFRLVGVELAGGEVCSWVETTAARVGCPDCGTVAMAHGRRGESR